MHLPVRLTNILSYFENRRKSVVMPYRFVSETCLIFQDFPLDQIVLMFIGDKIKKLQRVLIKMDCCELQV